MGGLMRSAMNLGFETLCLRVDVNDIDNSVLPCIVHWTDDHFVVLYKISAGCKLPLFRTVCPIYREAYKVAETGNHSSLLQNKGIYYNLVMNQLNLGD